jgi:predicted anti-sigma-YlaC factor YlaD
MTISHRTNAAHTPRRRALRLLAPLGVALLAGCTSLQHYAADRVGDALADSGTTFASDDDPDLIRDAAPFSLKLMESVLADRPDHAPLLVAAAGGFTQYAYAFVQQDADEQESRDLAQASALRRRARGLYLRARGYALRALDVRHPGFRDEFARAPQRALDRLDAEDAAALYWCSVAWAASISLSKDSARAIAALPKVDLMVARLAKLDASFDHGAFQSFLISYDMAHPGARAPERSARSHFERAVALSGGQRAAPYVALAENVSEAAQDRRGFTVALDRALAIDPDARPEWRLENLVMQRRARWLLSQTDQLFLAPLPGGAK